MLTVISDEISTYFCYVMVETFPLKNWDSQPFINEIDSSNCSLEEKHRMLDIFLWVSHKISYVREWPSIKAFVPVNNSNRPIFALISSRGKIEFDIQGYGNEIVENLAIKLSAITDCNITAEQLKNGKPTIAISLLISPYEYIKFINIVDWLIFQPE